MQGIIDTIASWITTLLTWLGEAFAWVFDLLQWVAQWIFSGIVSSVTVVLAAIPVPSWFANIDFSGVHPAVAYFGEPFRIGYGIGVVTSAYVIRFLIRRIPVIG